MELPLQTHFPLIQQSDNIFQFESESVIYKLSLYTTENLLVGYPGIIYEISFWPETNISKKFDPRIANTIIFFIEQVLSQNPETCICFICDSSDNKQLARRKLFGFWYNKYGNGYIKFDAEITGPEQIVYYNSIITNLSNPFFNLLKSTYFEAITDLSK